MYAFFELRVMEHMIHMFPRLWVFLITLISATFLTACMIEYLGVNSIYGTAFRSSIIIHH